MTTTSTEAQATQEVPTTQIDIDALILGRELLHPIHDDSGVLLLAAGSVITPTFKQLLLARGIRTVNVHVDDASALSLGAADLDIETTVSELDEQLVERIDEMIEAGNLFVANSGEAVKNCLVAHGCEAYDSETRDGLWRTHQQTSQDLDSMIQQALRGGGVDGTLLSERVAAYLTAMTADADCLLSVASEIGRDAWLPEHCLKTALLAMSIGMDMDLDETNIRNLGFSGLVHDWGMVRVPDTVRSADRALNEAEFLEIKKHPIYSLQMLERITGVPSIVPLVCYQVHERPDGTGYPKGRKQNETHLFARILKVADTYAALTAVRPQRPPLMAYAAIECLIRQAGSSSVDSAAVRSLLHVLSLFPIGSFLVLNDGSVARVLRRNGDKYATPIVQRIADQTGVTFDPSDESAIVDLSQSELRVVQALPTPGRTEVGLQPGILEPRR